jgi:hypothetical protein
MGGPGNRGIVIGTAGAFVIEIKSHSKRSGPKQNSHVNF